MSSWISIGCVNYLSSRTKIKEDTAIGLVLSVFFGFGILLLTIIQHQGHAAQSGLDQFLFGKAASLVGKDLWIFATISLIITISVIALYKEFKLLAFDRQFAKTIGYPVQLLETILTTLTVLAIVIGIQAVGVVLMAAMLITPAAAARFWTHQLTTMIIVAMGVGMLGGLSGAYISYLAPSMPTGPWIVLVISCLAIISFFIAPQKGIIAKMIQQRKNKFQILEENILKTLYHLNELDNKENQPRSIAMILEKRYFTDRLLKKGITRLRRKKLINITAEGIILNEAGQARGKRLAKLHRLWEVYLSHYLHVAADHVHEDAETIEHLLTPEIEKKLEELLQYPSKDPHQSIIPY